MARIVITSGPTREYLDPVRYLTNGSSGRMGCALAAAALAAHHDVTVISGPVQLSYPEQVKVVPVVTTDELLAACRTEFPHCDGLIAAAAPCDFRPEHVAPQKMRKTGRTLELRMVETVDVVATLAQTKQPGQWIVCFALETEQMRRHAMQKLRRKKCDLIVLNGPTAIDAHTNQVEILAPDGSVVAVLEGPKNEISIEILHVIAERLL